MSTPNKPIPSIMDKQPDQYIMTEADFSDDEPCQFQDEGYESMSDVSESDDEQLPIRSRIPQSDPVRRRVTFSDVDDIIDLTKSDTEDEEDIFAIDIDDVYPMDQEEAMHFLEQL